MKIIGWILIFNLFAFSLLFIVWLAEGGKISEQFLGFLIYMGLIFGMQLLCVGLAYVGSWMEDKIYYGKSK